MSARAIAIRPPLLALLRREVRCAYIRWRIREAEKDAQRLQEQMRRDAAQAEVFTSSIEAWRVLHAQVESGTD